MENDRHTGYASIDRPWLKYYSADALKAPLSKESLYDHLRRQNEGHGDDIAVRFFDSKLSYSDFFFEIDRIATSFSAIGVHSGDVVSFVAITTPEILASFYALNKIGAICNMLDPRMSEGTVMSLIEKAASRYVVSLDIFSSKIRALWENDTSKIIIVNTNVSSPEKAEFHTARHLSWKQFFNIGANRPVVPSVPYLENTPALIEYTGGTTGEPKGVLLSNDNINSVSDQYSHNGLPLRRGDSWQCVAAPFIAYVMILSTHVPLSHGITCAITVYDPNLIADDIVKGRYNHVAANPTVWEKVISSPDANGKDFSELLMPISGADSMSIPLQKKINRFLAEHGCKNVICNGYGMTESGIAGCVNLSKEVSKDGSVGIPFTQTCISVFIENSSEELPYNTVGEICIHGPSVMMGYFNNRQATEKALQFHNDGKLWLHTGDYGHIDEDGFVFIDGRIKRMLVKYNGAKVFPSMIEEVILKNDLVAKCAVIGVQDTQYAVGQVPVAFIVVKEPFEGSETELTNALAVLCKLELPEYACPAQYRILDSLPITPIGKIDFRALEKYAVDNRQGQ